MENIRRTVQPNKVLDAFRSYLFFKAHLVISAFSLVSIITLHCCLWVRVAYCLSQSNFLSFAPDVGKTEAYKIKQVI